jgi:hypothetical protein
MNINRSLFEESVAFFEERHFFEESVAFVKNWNSTGAVESTCDT